MQVSADGLLAAGGQYRWAPDQLARFRTAVDDERRGRDLEARLAALAATESWTGRRHAWPAIGSPPGPAASPPTTRGWTCCATAASTPTAGGRRTTSLHEAATAERVAAVWRATRPLTEWLDDHVGPSEHQR